MGEFLGVDPHQEVSRQDIKTTGSDDNGFPTDVEGVTADGVKKIGSEEFPIFKVDHDSFYSNMGSKRQRLRFKNGSNVQQYIKKTRNSGRPFYIRVTDANGKEYERKIR